MRIFAIADLHLSFNENIDKPMNIFGCGWENHTERMKEAWEKLVSDDDIVLIPGDISWAMKIEEAIDDFDWLHSLPGTKLISKGNHDLWWGRINYLNSLYDDIVFLQNQCYYVEGLNTMICATRGWPYPGSDEYTDHDDKIYKRELMRLSLGLEAAKEAAPDANLIVALHYPPSGADGRETEFTEMLEEYGVSQCAYGHLHGGIAFGRGIKGVYRGVEYKLVSQDYLGGIPKLILE
ncbi:MAG: metallophosphoesterase [Clostridiales bacterium]|nr:metallophosphoesterase [Candidatus Crickella caballi]